MAIKLSDLSEEERALILQEAKETIQTQDTNEIWFSQGKYLDDMIAAFKTNHSGSSVRTGSIMSDVKGKVYPFISYLMKMLLVTKYESPANCQSRAKTNEQLEDYKHIVDGVFDLIDDCMSGGTK